MNNLNTITKTNLDRLIGLLDPDSGISVTRNVYPDMINPKGHVTHKYIVDTINRDAKLSKLSAKDKNYPIMIDQEGGQVSRLNKIIEIIKNNY